MLHQEPTEEEQEQQRILDAWADARGQEPKKLEEDRGGLIPKPPTPQETKGTKRKKRRLEQNAE